MHYVLLLAAFFSVVVSSIVCARMKRKVSLRLKNYLIMHEEQNFICVLISFDVENR